MPKKRRINMAKQFIDLQGLTTFKNKYDEKIDNDFTSISTEDIIDLFDDLYAELTYTTTTENETVQIAYINSYFASVVVEETDEELLDGTQSEDNADTIEYTFAEAGTHTVKVRIIDSADLSYLFYNCTALTSVSVSLFMLATSNTTFAYTFYGCSSLTSLPSDLFASNTAVTDFRAAFGYCSSLTSIPSDLFANNTEALYFGSSVIETGNSNSSYGTFYYCSSLTAIPDSLFANCTKAISYYSCFERCSSITSIGEGVFANNTAATNFHRTFAFLELVTTLPEDLFADCTAVVTFDHTFLNCYALTAIPSSLFANNTLVTAYGACFYDNSALTGETPVNSEGLKLWELAGTDGYPSSIEGGNCFNGCTGLDDYDEIDDDWK